MYLTLPNGVLRGVKSFIPDSPFSSVRYTANWRQVYFGSCTVHIRQNKIGASWRCILHHRTVTAQCKILHSGVAVRQCKNNANWHKVYFGSCTVHIRQNKLRASWRCILHHQTATAWCKIFHCGVAVWQCKIHHQLAPSLFWELHSTYKAK